MLRKSPKQQQSSDTMTEKISGTRTADRGSTRSATTKGTDANTAPGAGTSRDSAKTGPVTRTAPEMEAADAMVVLHELGDEGTPGDVDEYLRNRGVVHSAMRLLEEWKFMPARITSSKVPVDIIALRRDMALLIQVISSKKPIPDAKTLVRHYAKKIDALRRMGTTAQFRKVLMAYSKLCGWKYYDVLPGGLIPAWDLPAVAEA